MSLLGEALKRQQEEGGGELPHQTLRLKGKEDESKPAESDTPPPDQPPPVKRPREWVAKGLVLLFILVLVGIVMALVSLLKSHDSEVVEPELLQPVARPIPVEPVVVEVDEAVVEDLMPADEAEGEEEVAEVEMDMPPSTPPVVVTPPAVVWPAIRIQAAMGSGADGSVLIEGAIIPVGQTHKGVELIEVTPQGVRAQFQGEERIIPVRR